MIFKAEVGSVTSHACQVQGVWVRPELRGRGLAETGMAAVVVEAARSIAPVVSLYVNDYNLPGPRRLPPGRLHRDRDLRVGAVLSAARAGPGTLSSCSCLTSQPR